MKYLYAITMLFVTPGLFASGLTASDLETTLARMDKAAAGFNAMKADVEWVSYTALVDDLSSETGTMAVRRVDGEVDLKVSFTTPYPRQLLIRGTKVESYKPRINTIEEYDVSKHKDKLDQALLLGFGVSGKFIREHYSAIVLGKESIDGQETIRLELIPTSEEMRRSVPKLEMWVSTETWQPVRQKLYQSSSGDYRVYAYSNIRINPPLKSSDFKLKTSGKVNRVRPR